MPNVMPAPGDAAPDFAAPDQTGTTIRLEDFAGKKLALYFYPKDDTPGCTKQACSLRDGYQRLQSEGVAIVGVSRDDEASHTRFAEKYDLPFPLLADTDGAVSEAYGAWGEKNFYGKKSIGMKRTTFLIDEEGAVVAVIKRPKTADHANEVLRKFGIGA